MLCNHLTHMCRLGINRAHLELEAGTPPKHTHTPTHPHTHTPTHPHTLITTHSHPHMPSSPHTLIPICPHPHMFFKQITRLSVHLCMPKICYYQSSAIIIVAMLYSSGQKRVPVLVQYYEHTKLITVSISSLFRFYTA